MTRTKASLVHLGISAAVGLIVLALLVMVWYPPPLFTAGGGAKLALIIVGVDVVLGPLLTFAVFKSGKPGLKFDLSVIALLQVSALIYGLHTALESRPAYLVAMPHRIVLVHANELHLDPPTDSRYARAPLWGPEIVGVRFPTDPDLRLRLLDEALSGMPDIEQRPAFYVPLSQVHDQLFSEPLPLGPLLDFNPDKRGDVLDWLRRQGISNPDDAAFIAVMTRESEIVMFVDTRRKRLLGMMNLPSNY